MNQNHLEGLWTLTAGWHPQSFNRVGLGWARETAFLTSSQVRLMVLIQGLQLENHCCRLCWFYRTWPCLWILCGSPDPRRMWGSQSRMEGKQRWSTTCLHPSLLPNTAFPFATVVTAPHAMVWACSFAPCPLSSYLWISSTLHKVLKYWMTRPWTLCSTAHL